MKKSGNLKQKKSLVDYGSIGFSKKNDIDLENITIEKNGEKYVKIEVNGTIHSFHLANDKSNRLSGMGIIVDSFKDAKSINWELNGDIIKIFPDIQSIGEDEGTLIEFLFEVAKKYKIQPENLKNKIILLKRFKSIEKEREEILDKLKDKI